MDERVSADGRPVELIVAGGRAHTGGSAGPVDGQTDGRTNGRTDGLAGGRTERREWTADRAVRLSYDAQTGSGRAG